MEVLSARMPSAFKGEESAYYKRLYENNKHGRKAETKVEHRSDKPVNYEAASHRESGNRKMYTGGPSSWEGGSRKTVVARSIARGNSDGGNMSSGYARRIERVQESSDEPETSQDNIAEDTDLSGEDEPSPAQAMEAPQKWPIIQIVDPPAWLPDGWTAVLRTRESGSKDKYYVDPVSQRRFRSKTEVNYYLQTGKSYRYKRNLALLTKPLKEDPVSLPNTVPLRTPSTDGTSNRDSSQTLAFMSPSTYGEHRSTVAPQSRPTPGHDVRLSLLPSGADPPKPRNKPGPKPRALDESGRPYLTTVSKRNVLEERKLQEATPSVENRGKLILKLKRKTAEPDEVQRNGKKQRPFEVVGATPVQGKSRSSTSSEEDRHHKPWSVDHAAETSRVLHSVSHQAPRRPASKNSSLSWQYQQQSATCQSQFGTGNGHLIASNGQGHVLERTSGSATLSITDSENAKFPQKRESPAEQLQKLGKRLCQQAVAVLSSEYGARDTLQQINHGLSAAMNPHGYSTSFHPHSNSGFNQGFSASFNSGFIAPFQHQPIKRMRGSLPKEKSILPMQKFGLDHHYLQHPQAV